VLSPPIELLEIVGGVIEVLAPIEAEPAHVALDGIDIFLRLLDRIGVVVAQVAVAAELLSHAEIEADRLGVADMEIAVRLRRKAGDHAFVPARGQVRANDVADEILAGFPYCRFSDRHAVIFGTARRWRCGARIEQIARPVKCGCSPCRTGVNLIWRRFHYCTTRFVGGRQSPAAFLGGKTVYYLPDASVG
jgi:hypothetical protein